MIEEKTAGKKRIVYVVSEKGLKVLKYFRELISGTSWYEGLTEKDKRKTRVFLKEHGIEPADWEEQEK